MQLLLIVCNYLNAPIVSTGLWNPPGPLMALSHPFGEIFNLHVQLASWLPFLTASVIFPHASCRPRPCSTNHHYYIMC